jgi:hypothetical protein
VIGWLVASSAVIALGGLRARPYPVSPITARDGRGLEGIAFGGATQENRFDLARSLTGARTAAGVSQSQLGKRMKISRHVVGAPRAKLAFTD